MEKILYTAWDFGQPFDGSQIPEHRLLSAKEWNWIKHGNGKRTFPYGYWTTEYHTTETMILNKHVKFFRINPETRRAEPT